MPQSTQKTDLAATATQGSAVQSGSDSTGTVFQGTVTAAPEGANQAAQSASQITEQVATAAATHPMPMESAFTWSGYIQAIGTLLILMAALWGVVWLVRKYGRFNFMPKPGDFPRDGLRVESQLSLGPRKGLMVVRFLNKRLLLGVTDHQITLLKETTDDNNANNMDFQELMDKAQRQKSDDECL